MFERRRRGRRRVWRKRLEGGKAERQTRAGRRCSCLQRSAGLGAEEVGVGARDGKGDAAGAGENGE